MTKNTIAIAKNLRRESAKASRKSQAIIAADRAKRDLRDVQQGAFDFAKGSASLVAAIKLALKHGTAEDVIRKAAMCGAMVYRLGKSLPDDDATRADILKEAETVLSLKAAHLGNTDAYRSADQQRAYEATKKIVQRAFGEAKGEPKTPRKPQPAKAATAAPAPVTGDKTPDAKPLNFAEYVKRPPTFTKPADVNAFARNLAALMSNELKQSAKAMPGDVRAMFTAFIAAAKALPDIEK